MSAPDTEFVLEQGKTVQATVTMLNNTDWPLKQGCKVCSIYDENTAKLLEKVAFVIQDHVAGKSNFELTIPLKLMEGVSFDSEPKDSFQADFSLQGPGGKLFGERISLKFRLAGQIDEA